MILVTGSASEADRISGLDRGADDVVVKPVSVAELVARVRAKIRGREALTQEQAASREHRRRLAAFLPELPRDAPLLSLAAALTDGLPSILDVDSVAILAFERGTARGIAAAGPLGEPYPVGKLVPHKQGADISAQASSGPWLETTSGSRQAGVPALEMAYVPFSLGASAHPIGSLVFGQRPDHGEHHQCSAPEDNAYS